MKRIRIGIMLLLFSILCLLNTKSVQAEVITGKCGDNAQYSYDSTTKTLTISGNGETFSYGDWENQNPFKKLSIAKVMINEGITRIEPYFLSECSMQTIQLPNTLEYIAYDALRDCKSLENLSIPNKVESIGTSAFEGCTSLKSITIPNSVKKMGYSVFRDCKSLTNVILPYGITTIEPYTFEYCTSLMSVTIPNSITDIKEEAFVCCGLTSLTIPNSVKRIGRGAFEDCDFKSVTIPNSVNKIESSAFSSCSFLESVNIPNSVNKIEYRTFEYCSSLKYVTIPNSVLSIDYLAFANCSSLKNITIPNSVMRIGSDAFSYSGLTEVTIPNSVQVIDFRAFANCYNLQKMTINNSNTIIAKDTFGYNEYGSKKAVTTNPILVLYGYKNSSTQKIANKYKIGFQTVGEKQAGKTKLISLASGKNGLQFQAKWKKVAKAYQYEIQIYDKADRYGHSNYLRSFVKGTSTKIKKNKNLKKGKTYYVRVRVYAKKNGKQIISPWSSVKKIKIK